MFDVLTRMRNMRITPISVLADGTLNIANRNLTVEKTSTGVYTFTMDRSHQQDMFVFPVCRADGVARHVAAASMADITEKVGVVKTYTVADSLADAPWDALIIGSDGKGIVHGVVPTKPMVNLARPRFLPFFYEGAGDTMYADHRWSGTMVKTGTGLYTLTFRRPFQQVPYVIAICSSTGRLVETTSVTATGASFEVIATVGGAAADSDIFIMVLGSDARQIFQRHLHVLKSPQPHTFLDPFEYDGVGGSPAMLRAGSVFTAVDNGTGDYTFTRVKPAARAGFAMAVSNGAAAICAVNNRTRASFKIQAEADAQIYGLSLAQFRGRDQA